MTTPLTEQAASTVVGDLTSHKLLNVANGTADTDGVNTAQMNWVYNTLSTNIATLTGKNRIINGACQVLQRGTASFAAGSSGYGGPDRFLCANSATSGTIQQSKDLLVYQGTPASTVRQTATVACTLGTGFIGGIQQRIESYNCVDLPSQTITQSFVFKASVAGTYTVAIAFWNGTNFVTYTSTFSYTTGGTPQLVKVTAPVSGTDISPVGGSAYGCIVYIGGLCTNTSAQATSTLNTWQTAANPLFGYTGATNWAATLNNYIEATFIQLEAGTVATPFERRPYGLEEALCKRYYQAGIPMSARGKATAAGDTITNTVGWPAMRAAPTSVQTAAGTNANANSWGLLVTNAAGGHFDLVAAAAGDFYALNAVCALSAEL